MKTRRGQIIVLLLLVILFSWGMWAILQTPPPARKAASIPAPPVVEVLPSPAGEHAILIHAWGRVEAKDPLDIRPQVEGRIVAMHPAFEPGGMIPAGEELVRIDDADYRLELDVAQTTLDKAQARLAIEGGKRRVAREEIRMLADSVTLDEASRALALRAPQLREARADVLAAKNAVAMARLHLERTRIDATHELIVLEKDRRAGDLVNRGERVGRVASATQVWVFLQVDPAQLGRLHASSAEQPGSPVEIHYQGAKYDGRLTRILHQLSPQTRQAQVLVEIDDPFNLQAAHASRPLLLIGSYVEARIHAGSLPDSIAIPREQVLDNHRVWVVDADERLRIRIIEPLFEEPAQTIARPLHPGDRLLKGNPAGLLPGTTVRIKDLP